MFINGVEAVHFEPTARCNASCPMCARTGNDTILSNQGEVTYEAFVKFFPSEFVRNLRQFKFCGNFGDPIVAKDIVQMHEYLIEHNPDMSIILSTNGGIRSKSTWNRLGELYSLPNKHLQFHIDGLEDTNHIYRVGVKWDKVINNVKTFIDAGGYAEWFYIPFFHNEHQVEEARELSQRLGFKHFVVKSSARFKDSSKPHVKGNIKTYPPTDPEFRVDKYQVDGSLICFAEVRKEIYVDAWGRLFPCCWTGSRFFKENSWPHHVDPDSISLYNRRIDEIHDDPNVNIWIDKMYADEKSVCNMRCTGSHQHVLDIDGFKKPQKDMWLIATKEIK